MNKSDKYAMNLSIFQIYLIKQQYSKNEKQGSV